MTNLEEKTITSENILKGKLLNARRDTVITPKGECFREIVDHPGGVAIAAFKDEKNIILIKQWRYAANQALIELPAGKLEIGEEPLECAKRELTEETGYEAKNWEFLGHIYTTPGFCTEKIYLYKAFNLEFKGTNYDEFELIESFITPIETIKQMVKNGEIVDSKTICGLFHIFNIG